MEKKREYYLIVPSEDVWVTRRTEDFAITDSDWATKIFEENNVPPEFRKIVLKISIGNIMRPYDAFELTTSEMYHFYTPLLRAILNPKEDKTLFIISFETRIYTENKFYHVNEAREFYQKLVDSGNASNYAKAMEEIYIKRQGKKQTPLCRKKKKEQ